MKSKNIVLLIIVFAAITFSCTSHSDKNNDKSKKINGKISLLTSNKNYVCAPDDTSKFKLIANRNTIGEWETFQISYLDNDKVTLKSFKNKYVCADSYRNDFLFADKLEVRDSEEFTLIILGENQIALKASNGKFVSADIYLGGQLIANRDKIGDWEKFTLVQDP